MNFILFILTFKLNKFGGRVEGSLQFNSSLFATSLRSKSCTVGPLLICKTSEEQ